MISVGLGTFEMKKADGRKRRHASEVRFGDFTAKNLRAYAGEVRNAAAALEGVADTMDEYNIKMFEHLDGATKVTTGIQSLKDFLERLEKAIVREKYKRGL
jgi:hypothetical protein